ncbi:MAG: type II secretion system protein [Microcystis sp. M162S2]|uniref:prepilin-type N-terminal cleavage/methylation domain-containing protein n=1 Tax=Microcystis sp. M162S2 TaxID=2771154 RepID=UPI002586B9A7|nr:prepilin-type N-terminal cleavage/methylation domain-containing protein [Microcystis sp. M162S2]MCA2729692.1 type II secretion system protein [Microcystis sp. M162S2]
MRKINTRLFLIKYLLSNQSGFSLLEALMAILVVSILMTAILPMIILSTATRVQSRRVDLATQAARGYIDGVRSGVIDITTAGAAFPFINNNQDFQGLAAPSSVNIADLNGIQGIKVDTNGNGFNVTDPQDLVIQPMRTGGIASGAELATQGFYMQVRVYRADAFTQDATGNLNGIQAGLTLQTGNGDTCPNGRGIVTNTGGGKNCPLVVMKVDINPSTSTMNQIKNRL